jgi:hypothetical protein
VTLTQDQDGKQDIGHVENGNMIKLKDILNEAAKPGPIEYPKDYKPGMKVTKGGSMCANCEYWIEEGNICNNQYWLKWRKGNAKIPVNADEYCCDWWHAN